MYAGNNPVIEEKYEGSTLIETLFYIIVGGSILGLIRKKYGVTDDYKYFYLDNLGSRRVVLDAAGSVTDRFTYSAYGEVTHDSGPNADLASFSGKGYDSTGLLYFNARYLDPVVGRFLTEDPSRDGTNWYGYCNNNPVNMIDPTGMWWGKESKADDSNDSAPKDNVKAEKKSFIGRLLDKMKTRYDNIKQKKDERNIANVLGEYKNWMDPKIYADLIRTLDADIFNLVTQRAELQKKINTEIKNYNAEYDFVVDVSKNNLKAIGEAYVGYKNGTSIEEAVSEIIANELPDNIESFGSVKEMDKNLNKISGYEQEIKGIDQMIEMRRTQLNNLLSGY